MIVNTLGWFVAGISVAGFDSLWFVMSYKELSAKEKSLGTISEQVQMHRRLYMQERGGDNDAAAKKILENKLMVYRELEKSYQAMLKMPMNRIPAYILGFHSAGKDRGNNLY